MQTAINWLISVLAHNDILDHKALSSNERLYNLYKRLKEQAEAKEKQQIIDAANITKEDRWFDAKLYNNCGEKYFAETYGSKGSDEIKCIGSKDINGNEMVFDQELFNYFSQEFNISLLGTEIQDIIDIVKKHTSSQTEISDEKIENRADEYFKKHIDDMGFYGFIEGAKWYREQLKKKNL